MLNLYKMKYKNLRIKSCKDNIMKTGKTTLGSQMPSPLVLAFERGYNAIANIFAQDVTSWSEMKQIVNQLKKKEVKERFKTVVIDTVN